MAAKRQFLCRFSVPLLLDPRCQRRINTHDRMRNDRDVASQSNLTQQLKLIVGGEMTLSKRTGTVERAFELAYKGECRTISGLVERLSREGFNDVQEHFLCLSTRRQLNEALRFLDL